MGKEEALWAMEWLGIGECTFSMIPIGGYFKYHRQTEPPYRKTSPRWFVSPDGRKWTTGQNTAVFPVRQITAKTKPTPDVPQKEEATIMSDKTGAVVTLSTAHITQSTAQLLSGAGIPNLTVYPKAEYGWFIAIQAEPELAPDRSETPADLQEIFDFVNGLKVDWLILDRDGETLDALPIYDW